MVRQARKQLWEILIPTTRNGRVIPETYHHGWDEFVRKLTGGLTLLRTVKGQWVAPTQELVAEPMIPVRILCTRRQFKEILAFSSRYYEQEIIMAYCISSEVVFHHRKR